MVALGTTLGGWGHREGTAVTRDIEDNVVTPAGDKHYLHVPGDTVAGVPMSLSDVAVGVPTPPGAHLCGDTVTMSPGDTVTW